VQAVLPAAGLRLLRLVLGLLLSGSPLARSVPRVAVETATSPEAVRAAELVLFCVKTVDTETAAATIAPHLGAATIVVDLQNGVDNAERMRRVGVDPIPAVVYVAAAIERPGEVKHRGRGDLVIGAAEHEADLARVAGWLGRAGIGCRIADDVHAELWLKLVVNSMMNAVSAITDAAYGERQPFAPSWQIAVDVATEAVAVATAEGVPLVLAEVVETARAIAVSIGDATSSTQQDIANRRPTEIDALNGYIVARGRELGIATPVNRMLCALVQQRERVLADRDLGKTTRP